MNNNAIDNTIALNLRHDSPMLGEISMMYVSMQNFMFHIVQFS